MDINEQHIEITAGFRERMRRLALFDPLYELDRKKAHDQNGKAIDMKGLGLIALLFFFEQKVMRNTKTGTKDLAFFIKDLSQEQYSLDEKSYEQLARTIVQTFRPTTGKKRTYPFYNWETKTEEEQAYSLLKANAFDSKTNTQFYTLDDDGLELVFATKEFYSEFQLSINQLMLRKQLDKGEFRGALRQINEMRIDVEALNERMVKLRHEIQRNIVSEDTFDRYKQLLDDIHTRLQRENEEFDELRQFVQETKERLYEKDYHKKEQKTYAYVVKLTNELEDIHYEHSRLLQQSIDLKNHTLKSAQESLYYSGIDSFNFDQDITARVVSSPLPLEGMKGLMHPFFSVHQEKQWSPLTVFAEQNIREDRDDSSGYGFIELGDENETDHEHQWLQQNYGNVMKVSLQALESGCTQLDEVIHYLIEEGQASILKQRFFYDFWLLLHQRSPIVAGQLQLEEKEQHHILDDALAQLGRRSIRIQERTDILAVTERFSIQNMTITLQEDEFDAL